MANSVVFEIFSTREQVETAVAEMKRDDILLSVHADDSTWMTKAKNILEISGADDIASTGETKGDYGNFDKAQ